MLEKWAVYLAFLWGLPEKYRVVYKLMLMIDVAEDVNAWLRAQARHQPTISEALVQLVQIEFNENFRQVFTSSLPFQ